MEQAPSESELKLVRHVEQGEWAIFSKKDDVRQLPKPKIRADLLRRLILGIPLLPGYSTRNGNNLEPIKTPNGIRIEGAEIQGVLDLADGGGSNGTDCPALVLVACDLSGGTRNDNYGGPRLVSIDARHVRLKRLSLKKCRFHGLDLSGAELSGDFDFSGAQPLKEKDCECWVVARDARIDGTVRAANATLRIKSIASTHPDQSREYALDLKGVEVEGSVMLRPGFRADGGMNVSSCKIGGDLWLDGATLISPEGYAFSAQMATIDGVVALCMIEPSTCPEVETSKVFSAQGIVNFYQATLGMLNLSGAVLSPATKKTDSEAVVLNAHLVTIRGDLHMYWTEIKAAGAAGRKGSRSSGDVDLSNATIGGAFWTFAVKLGSIIASDITVRGRVILHGQLWGKADFSGAQIEGEMSLGTYQFRGLGNRQIQNSPLQVGVKHDSEESDVEDRITLQSAAIDRIKVVGIDVVKIGGIPKPLLIRTKALACYPNMKLGEALYHREKGREYLIVSFLADQNNWPTTILSGDSTPIHELNGRGALKIETQDQAKEYLRFFCANVWGGEGAFIIVEETGISTNGAESQITSLVVDEADKDKPWTASATVTYANWLFKAKFRIDRNGMVTMLQDEPVGESNVSPKVLYARPFRRIRRTGESTDETPEWPLGPVIPGNWTDAKDVNVQQLNSLIGEKASSEPSLEPSNVRVEVNLRGAHTEVLDDHNGERWGEKVLLNLDGFVYEGFGYRIPRAEREAAEESSSAQSVKGDFREATEKKSWEKQQNAIKTTEEESSERPLRVEESVLDGRKKWLQKQYHEEMPDGPEFMPQPFDQLVRIFRRDGLWDAADDVTIMKRQLERRVKFCEFKSEFISWLKSLVEGLHFRKLDGFIKLVKKSADLSWDKLFYLSFKYGLRISRAFLTCAVLIVGGCVGVEFANYGHVRFPPWSSEERHPPSWVPSFLRMAPLKNPILVVETTPVSTGVIQGQDATGDVNKLVSSRVKEGIEEIPCHEAIDSLWYAIDVAVPVLDLNQESKCTISSGSHAWGWRIGKQLYAIVGALITALTVLTVSGILRRHLSKSD